MKTKKRRRGGFSLTELLTVITLLGILAALAIPAVIQHQRDLKLTELDDNARTIYLAAQSRLTALRSAEGDTLALNGSTGRPAETGTTLDGGTQLYYVATDQANTDWLVLSGAIEGDLAENGYLVEFDPVSGTVYGVFCTDEARALSGWYSTLAASCRSKSGRSSFAGASNGFPTGYYGADGALDLARPDKEKLPRPRLRVINNEELAVEFWADNDTGMSDAKIFYDVTMEGRDGAGNAQSVKLKEKGTFNSGKHNAVVLDTFRNILDNSNTLVDGWMLGKSFTNWVKAGDTLRILPGTDVTVTVTVWCEAGPAGAVALPQSRSVTVNSLFANRDGDTVRVEYGRQLQNLGLTGVDPAIHKVVQGKDIDFAATGGALRECWGDIYGRKTVPFQPLLNYAITEFDGNGYLIKNLYETTSKDAGLFRWLTVDNDTGAITLKNITMVDAQVQSDATHYAGSLVGKASGKSANKITIQNCRSYLTRDGELGYTNTTRIKAGQGAGGLVGFGSHVNFRDSFASTVVESARYAGGLVGACINADSVKLERCYSASQVTGAAVGGLVSGHSVAVINDCYAAGTLIPKGGYAGMSLGTAKDPVTNADVEITLDMDGDIGGLSAYLAKITGSYAAVNILPEEGKSYHIYPVGKTGTYSSYTNDHYLAVPGIVYDELEAALEGVTRVKSSEEMLKSGSLTGLGDVFREGDGTEATYGVETYPYNLIPPAEGEERLTAPYPYPTILYTPEGGTLQSMPHYGDWFLYIPEPTNGLIAYYERESEYTGYEFSYYTKRTGATEQGNLNLNRTGALRIDGYAYLAPEKLPEVSAGKAKVLVAQEGIESGAYQEYTLDYLCSLNEDGTVHNDWDGKTEAWYAYALPDLGVSLGRGNYYYRIQARSTMDNEDDLADAWYNPHFGREAYNGYANSRPSKQNSAALRVRSLRQLNYTRRYGNNDIVQELDIDAMTYKGYQGKQNGILTVCGLPVFVQDGDEWVPYTGDYLPWQYRLRFTPLFNVSIDSGGKVGRTGFSKTYDGKGRAISHLSVTPYTHSDTHYTHYSGLFALVQSEGVIRDLTVQECDFAGVWGEDSTGSGALAGECAGRIAGCTVQSCDILADTAFAYNTTTDITETKSVKVTKNVAITVVFEGSGFYEIYTAAGKATPAGASTYTVYLPTLTSGSITASATENVSKNTVVTFTVTPPEGMELKQLFYATTDGKTGGSVGGMVGKLSGGIIGQYADGTAAPCKVEYCTVYGGNNTGDNKTGVYNTGGLVGYITGDNKTTCGVYNCTVRDTQVSNRFVYSQTTSSVEKYGSTGGLAGMWYRSKGAIQNCSVVGTATGSAVVTGQQRVGGFIGTMQPADSGVIGGDSVYAGCTAVNVAVEGLYERDNKDSAVYTNGAGGFVGVMANGTIRYSSAYLAQQAGSYETPASLYPNQKVTAKRDAGGFVGNQAGGTVEYCSASVQVSGENAGGFAGRLTAGAVAHVYSGGRTVLGEYDASLPNVTGTGKAGGLIGLWDGGTLTDCYTTCAVAGPNDLSTDILANPSFAVTDAHRSALTGSYALGLPFIGGEEKAIEGHNKLNMATEDSMTEIGNNARAVTNAYDVSLQGSRYPYEPIRYPNSVAMPHHGDWYYPLEIPEFPDWDTIEPEVRGDLTARMQWDGDYVFLEFLIANAWDSADKISWDGGYGNGWFSLITDLGYERVFRASQNGTIIGMNAYATHDFIYNNPSATWEGGTWHWQIALKARELPPYLRYIRLEFYNSDRTQVYGNITDLQGVQDPALKIFSGVFLDGAPEDWMWYHHNGLHYGGPQEGINVTEGVATLYAEDNVLYTHYYTEHPDVLAQGGKEMFTVWPWVEGTNPQYQFVAPDASGYLRPVDTNAAPGLGVHHYYLVINSLGLNDNNITLDELKERSRQEVEANVANGNPGGPRSYYGEAYLTVTQGRHDIEIGVQLTENRTYTAYVSASSFNGGNPISLQVVDGYGAQKPVPEAPPGS